MSECNRCHCQIAVGEDETCWWCIEPLCYECWDLYGHCGHEEAERFNEYARNVNQPDGLDV